MPQAKAGNREAAANAAFGAFEGHQSWAGLQMYLQLACRGQVTA